jgi:hypothetical protein
MASNGEIEVMKKSRYTEEQMVTVLRETDKASVAEVAKKHEAADVKRLKQLEHENARLKKMWQNVISDSM